VSLVESGLLTLPHLAGIPPHARGLRLPLFSPFHALGISFVYVEVSEVRDQVVKFSHDPISSFASRLPHGRLHGAAGRR
jgi:hypothetical protein